MNQEKAVNDKPGNRRRFWLVIGVFLVIAIFMLWEEHKVHMVGKQLGVFAFAWLAVRLGLAKLPTAVRWRHLYATGVLAGIGFTMSLFISGLAFEDTVALTAARQGVLSASALSALIGGVLLYRYLPLAGKGRRAGCPPDSEGNGAKRQRPTEETASGEGTR